MNGKQLTKMNPFANPNAEEDGVNQSRKTPVFTHDLYQQMINDLPSSLLGALTGHPGEVTYLWLEKNIQSIQHSLAYISCEYQFRLLGFVPSALLLKMLIDQDSDRRSRFFEWCVQHASSRTTRKMIQIKEDTDAWISDCERRLSLFGGPGAPGYYKTQASLDPQHQPEDSQSGEGGG